MITMFLCVGQKTIFMLFSPSLLHPSPSPPPTRSTPPGRWTNLFVKRVSVLRTLTHPFLPPQLPSQGPAPAPASQPTEIEMLRAGTTAPLIKFPRLIPAGPLIALSHPALRGGGGGGSGRGNNKQTLNTHTGLQKCKKTKEEAECENEKTETAQNKTWTDKYLCGA